jgi:hypothetical protein
MCTLKGVKRFQAVRPRACKTPPALDRRPHGVILGYARLPLLKRTWPATSPRHQLRLAPAARCRSFSLLLSERESSGMSAEAVVQDHGAVRRPLVSQRPKPSRAGDREDACSISAVGNNGVSSGACRDAVSGAVREEVCACLFVVRSYLSILQSPCAWQRFRTRNCPRMRPTLGTFLPAPVYCTATGSTTDHRAAMP